MSLEGRIERVSIISKHPSYSAAWGEYKERQYPIFNGKEYIGKDCVVRFSIKEYRGCQWGNIIAEDLTIPTGLAPEEFILVGLWVPERDGFISQLTIHDINRLYDPGEIPWFIYCEKENSPNFGRWIVYSHENHKREATEEEPLLLRRLRKQELPDPTRASRMILCESKHQLKQIEALMKEDGITPIRMEPLRK